MWVQYSLSFQLWFGLQLLALQVFFTCWLQTSRLTRAAVKNDADEGETVKLKDAKMI